MIKICGSSGFIGKSLLNNLENSEGVSLRMNNWRQELSESSIIINLIGKAHDHKGKSAEHEYYYANLKLLREIFGVFINSKATLLIHISSIAAVEEYGRDEALDEMASCHPISFYGKSKREAEKWLLAQKLPVGKKVVILRPPMVHGPGDKGNLGLLYKLISKGIPYPLASFTNNRSFVSIANFCFFIHEIISQKDKLQTGIYNIADDESISTNELIKVIRNVTNKSVPNFTLPQNIVKLMAKFGDIVPFPLNTKRLKKMTSNLLVSNDKIKKILGIQKLPLSAEQGLETTIKSFKQAN